MDWAFKTCACSISVIMLVVVLAAFREPVTLKPGQIYDRETGKYISLGDTKEQVDAVLGQGFKNYAMYELKEEYECYGYLVNKQDSFVLDTGEDGWVISGPLKIVYIDGAASIITVDASIGDRIQLYDYDFALTEQEVAAKFDDEYNIYDMYTLHKYHDDYTQKGELTTNDDAFTYIEAYFYIDLFDGTGDEERIGCTYEIGYSYISRGILEWE